MTSIIKGTAYYTLGNVLPQLAGFLLLPVYSKYMTPSQFGIVAAMETINAIFAIIVCCSLDRAAQRFYFDSDKLDVQKKILSTLFIASMAFAIIFLVMALLAEPLLQPIFKSIPFHPYFIYCIASVSLNSLSLITTLYYQVSEQPRLYLLLRTFRLFTQVLLTVSFVVFLRSGAEGQLQAELLTVLLFSPIYLVIAHRNFNWQFDFNILKKALAYSWPFIPTLLVAWILNLSDRIFLDYFIGLDSLGIYSMGYKISMAFFIFTGAFTLAYMPIFYKLANSESQIGAKEKIYKYSFYSAVFFVILVFLFSLFAKEIVAFALDDKYRSSYALIRLFLISHILSAIMGITSSLFLLQAKLTKLNMFISLQAGLLNLLLNYLLIPYYGVYGAAVATVLSIIELTIIQYHVSKVGYFVVFPWGKISFILALLGTIIGSYHFYLESFSLEATVSKIILLSLFLLALYWKRFAIQLLLKEAGLLDQAPLLRENLH